MKVLSNLNLRLVSCLVLILFWITPVLSEGTPKNLFFYSQGFLSKVTVMPPFYFRNIPIHEDDGYVPRYNAGPIDPKFLKTSGIFLLGVGAYFYLSQNYLFEMKCSFITLLNDDIVERNYTNEVGTENRDEGAALTYCLLQQGDMFLPEMSIERIVKNNLLSIGLSASYFTIRTSNGWDRWGCLEKKENYLLARCLPVSLYLKVYLWKGFSIYGGPSIINALPTTRSKEFELKYDKTGLSFNWDLRPF